MFNKINQVVKHLHLYTDIVIIHSHDENTCLTDIFHDNTGKMVPKRLHF